MVRMNGVRTRQKPRRYESEQLHRYAEASQANVRSIMKLCSDSNRPTGMFHDRLSIRYATSVGLSKGKYFSSIPVELHSDRRM